MEQRNEEKEQLIEAEMWYREAMAGKVIAALKKNNITGIYVETKEEARKQVLSMIPEGSKVAQGGSLSLSQAGIIDALRQGNYNFMDRLKPGLSEAEVEALRRESLLADIFLMSTNALTMDGKLVNIDGYGNRVAALSYGPLKVIILAGLNKVVPDQEAAVRRIKDYVAPIHARRRNRPVPCAKTGVCVDCRAPERSCNILSVIEHQRDKERITVVLCGEDLGL